jgi:subtilisin family serine protease
VRIEANAKVFERMKELTREGKAQLAIAALTQLGADEAAARSAASAFAQPAASGVVSVMYCSGNVAQDVEPFAVVTNSADESWLTFPPAMADGPVVLEQTSVGALTARILVGVSAKLVMPV